MVSPDFPEAWATVSGAGLVPRTSGLFSRTPGTKSSNHGPRHVLPLNTCLYGCSLHSSRCSMTATSALCNSVSRDIGPDSRATKGHTPNKTRRESESDGLQSVELEIGEQDEGQIQRETTNTTTAAKLRDGKNRATAEPESGEGTRGAQKQTGKQSTRDKKDTTYYIEPQPERGVSAN